MAFDITPYIDKSPAEVRGLIRQGVIDFPTAGMCRGYAQANLVILPPEYADDFEEYTKKNPFPCPVLEIIRGTPETHAMGEGGTSSPTSPATGCMRTACSPRSSPTLRILEGRVCGLPQSAAPSPLRRRL